MPNTFDRANGIGDRMRLTAHVVLVTLLVTGLLSGCSAPPRVSPADAIAGLRIARIDGQSSGRSWLTARGDSIVATGLIGSGTSVQNTRNGMQAVVELLVAERVGGVTLFHLVPLTLPNDAKVTLDGKTVDVGRMADIHNRDPEPDLTFGTAVAVFVLDGDRPTARSLIVKSSDADLPADAPQASPNDGFVRAAELDPNAPWLTIRRGTATSLKAYFAGGTSESGTEGPTSIWEYYYVPDSLGSATVFHAISVSAKPATVQLAKPGTDVELRITVDGPRFVMAN